MAVLVSAQQVPSPTNFKIPHCNSESSPQLRCFQNGLQALLTVLGQLVMFVV